MSYRAEVLATNPVAYWRLGEASGTVAADEKGANNGTYVGTPTLGAAGLLTGDANTAVTLNGTTQHVARTMTPGGPTSAVTLLVWGRHDLEWNFNASLNHYLITWGVIGSGGYHFLRLYSNTSIQYGFSDGADRVALVSFSFSLSTVYQLAVTHDFVAKTATLYVNGAPVGTVSLAAFGAPAVVASGRALRIGAYTANDNHGWGGAVDEPAVWTRALTAVEIDTLYRVGLATLTVVRSSDAGTGTETAGLAALIAATDAGSGVDLASPAVVAGGGTVTVTATPVSTVTVTATLLVGPN